MTTTRKHALQKGQRRPHPGRVLGVFALALALVALVHATLLITERGLTAFSPSGWARPDFVVTSAVIALVLAPLLLLAFLHASRARYRAGAIWLAWAVVLFGLSILVPRGVFATGWYAVPLCVLLVTCMFGPRHGLGQAALSVSAVLVSAWLLAGGHLIGAPLQAGVWTHAGVIGTVVVAMALCGSLLHRTLHLAISAEETQLERMDRARRALRHRENLLRHAMRVETVGEMSSMVVHQLRNQFQLILGYATLGRRKAGGDAVGYFDSIVETLGKSSELVESLLGLARSEGGDVHAVDLSETCVHLCESYSRVLPGSIEMLLEHPGQPVWVMLDPVGLEHALLNLVINARQAIHGRGRITVRVSKEGAMARIAVEDDGMGIAEEHLEAVFRPFFTTKERGRGTGLGLAAVQRFATSSNGMVDVSSRVGVGTTFILRFPLIGQGAGTANGSAQVG